MGSAPRPGSGSGRHMSPLRLLLVEDHAALREVVCEALQAEGFEVVTADDGAQALELLQEDRSFDVLVLDDEMPRLTGHELLARLRAEGSQVAAVLYSGSLELSEGECARLGVGPVLRKPLLFPQLAAAIRQAIEARRQR